MRIAIKRWGNSLALRIPQAFAAETHLSEGTPVNLALDRGRLVVTPSRTKKYRLADLVKGIKSAETHPEQFTDEAVGKEAW